VIDLTKENILKAFENAPKEVRDTLLDAMGNRGFSLFRFETTVKWYEKMGLLKEIK